MRDIAEAIGRIEQKVDMLIEIRKEDISRSNGLANRVHEIEKNYVSWKLVTFVATVIASLASAVSYAASVILRRGESL